MSSARRQVRDYEANFLGAETVIAGVSAAHYGLGVKAQQSAAEAIAETRRQGVKVWCLDQDPAFVEWVNTKKYAPQPFPQPVGNGQTSFSDRSSSSGGCLESVGGMGVVDAQSGAIAPPSSMSSDCSSTAVTITNTRDSSEPTALLNFSSEFARG